MKKDYLRPEAEIIDIITSSLMQITSTVGEGNGGEILSNKHRGDWNNIWGEEE